MGKYLHRFNDYSTFFKKYGTIQKPEDITLVKSITLEDGNTYDYLSALGGNNWGDTATGNVSVSTGYRNPAVGEPAWDWNGTQSEITGLSYCTEDDYYHEPWVSARPLVTAIVVNGVEYTYAGIADIGNYRYRSSWKNHSSNVYYVSSEYLDNIVLDTLGVAPNTAATQDGYIPDTAFFKPDDVLFSGKYKVNYNKKYYVTGVISGGTSAFGEVFYFNGNGYDAPVTPKILDTNIPEYFWSYTYDTPKDAECTEWLRNMMENEMIYLNIIHMDGQRVFKVYGEDIIHSPNSFGYFGSDSIYSLGVKIKSGGIE